MAALVAGRAAMLSRWRASVHLHLRKCWMWPWSIACVLGIVSSQLSSHFLQRHYKEVVI